MGQIVSHLDGGPSVLGIGREDWLTKEEEIEDSKAK